MSVSLFATLTVTDVRRVCSVKRAFNVLLAVSLVHYYPPKHHIRALRIIEEVLSEEPDNIACLMSRGYVMQRAHKWDEAAACFHRVAELAPDDVVDGLRAREEEAWCMVETHNSDAGEKALMEVVDVLDGEEGRENDKARCWWRLGKSRRELGGEQAIAVMRTRPSSLQFLQTMNKHIVVSSPH